MPKHIARVFDSSFFRHNAQRREFVADASELGVKPGCLPGNQLYDDAADIGLGIRSPRDNTVFFYMNDEGGGEIWTFLIDTYSERKYPHLKGYKVIIFND